MSGRAILALGPGSVSGGFPAVTARLEQAGSWMQVTGSLPSAPDLPDLYRNWRLLYEALYQSRHRSGIEFEPAGITHFSAGDFTQVQQRLAQRFNQWLGTGSFQPIETQLRTQLDPGQTIRLIVETDDGDAWHLPWHCWDLVRLDYRRAEIILSTPSYPPVPTTKTRSNRSNKITMKLLAILGNHTGIDVEHDRQMLQHLPGVVPTLLDEPQRRTLTEKLWASGWDILFFAGHSTSQPDATGGRLYINQHPQHNSLTMAELQEALHQVVQKGLQLAIFNSCDGLGLVRDLAAEAVPLPVTIAMREPVPDAVAQEFLKYFLQEFAYGTPFYWAVRQAREKLKGIEDEYPGASGLPVVCQHPAAEPPVWSGLKAVPGRPPSWFKPLWGTVAVLLACSLLGYWVAGPWLSVTANRWGNDSRDRGQLSQAALYYRLSRWLNPRFPVPYYNLGSLCEDSLHDLDCAREEYWKALQLGLPEAHARLAKLQLEAGKGDAAHKHLWQCLELTSYDAVKAACLKSRGWLRFEDRRFQEAEADLRAAIRLQDDSPHAYCLLAQVLDARGRGTEARDVWEKAQRYAQHHYNRPELDRCLGLAHQRLQSQGDLP